MEAHNLTISVPPPSDGPTCDKNCPYCISAMTGFVEPALDTMLHNIEKAKTLARAAHVSNVLLTGKGEPLINFDITYSLLRKFSEFPLEIQTNGLWLSKNVGQVDSLKSAGLDTIAISVDTIDKMDDLEELINMIRECNMTCRICLNLTDMIEPDFHSIFDDIRQFLPHQLLIRNIMIPKVVHYDTQRSVDVSEWIEAHAGSNMYNKLYIDFMETIDRDLDLVRVLPHGAEVFHVEGIDISFSDYCIQEYNNTKDIRSLIFLEDGHMYTSWDKIPGSRLF